VDTEMERHRPSVIDEHRLNEDADPDQLQAVNRWKKLTPVLWRKFTFFRKNLNRRQRLRFDEISPILKRFFMEQSNEYDREIATTERKWTISFKAITTISPNVKELHFVNRYKFDDDVLRALISQIQEINNMVERVVFLYFDCNGNGIPSEMETSICFRDPRNLNADLLNVLTVELQWTLEHRSIRSGGGYKITVHHTKRD